MGLTRAAAPVPRAAPRLDRRGPLPQHAGPRNDSSPPERPRAWRSFPLISIRPLTSVPHAAIQSLATQAALAAELHALATSAEIADTLADPHGASELGWVAFADGAPVGLCHGFVLPATGGGWSMLRLGVAAAWRRRGVGTRLLATATAGLRKRSSPPAEQMIAAWSPNPAAAAFAAHHGFAHARGFWTLRRAATPCPAPEWPAGITLRTFDGSEAALADWTDIYHRSFADHYHFVPSPIAVNRAMAALKSFRDDGLALAWRGGACVGFCRNAIVGGVGEVAMLGVAPGARGIGLGRALLRWGVRWLEAEGAAPIELRVDGANESALALYRSEAFAPSRQRQLWTRPLPLD